MSKGALKVKTPDGFRVVGSGLVENTESVTGVSSFNARTGTVIPQKGDYSADMIAFSDGETFQQKYDSGELKGDEGVGIQSVQQTTTSSADGGENVVTVTLTNGQKSTFKFKNGSRGSPGATPTKGKDYFTSEEVVQIVADAVAQVIASGELADANHSHSASEVGARSSSWTPSQTQVTVSDATDYTTNRVRGIALAQDNPISVQNGCLCGVYTIS